MKEKARGLSVHLRENVEFDTRKFVVLEDETLSHNVRYRPKYHILYARLSEKYNKKIRKPIILTMNTTGRKGTPYLYVRLEKGSISGETYRRLAPNKLFKFLGNIFKLVEKTKNVQES